MSVESDQPGEPNPASASEPSSEQRLESLPDAAQNRPTVYWEVPPTPSGPVGEPQHVHPVIRAIVWIAGLFGLAILALAYAAIRLPSAPATPYEASRAAGTVIGAAIAGLLIGFVVRGAWVWWGRRSGKNRQLLSPVVALIGCLFLLAGIIGSSRAPSPAPSTASNETSSPSPAATAPRVVPSVSASPSDIDAFRTISAPFTLRPAEADEAQAMEDLLLENAGDSVGDIRVDRVYDGASFLGYVAVVGIPDMTDVTGAFALAGAEAEIQKNPDAKLRRSTVNGRTALIVEIEEQGLAIWTESGFMKMVIAIDKGQTVPIAEAAARRP